LSESVARLGQVGRTIGEELDTQVSGTCSVPCRLCTHARHDCAIQGKMLDELEEDVDGTTTRLGAAQKKLVQVIKRSGMGGQMAIVGVLVVRVPTCARAESRDNSRHVPGDTDYPRRPGRLHVPLRDKRHGAARAVL